MEKRLTAEGMYNQIMPIKEPFYDQLGGEVNIRESAISFAKQFASQEVPAEKQQWVEKKTLTKHDFVRVTENDGPCIGCYFLDHCFGDNLYDGVIRKLGSCGEGYIFKLKSDH